MLPLHVDHDNMKNMQYSLLHLVYAVSKRLQLTPNARLALLAANQTEKRLLCTLFDLYSTEYSTQDTLAPFFISSLSEAFTKKVAPAIHILNKKDHQSPKQFSELLISLGYTKRQEASEFGEFATRGHNTTLILTDTDRLVISAGKTLSFLIYNIESHTTLPQDAYALEILNQTKDFPEKAPFENINADYLITPTLISLFLQKKSQDPHYTSLEEWHEFLTEKPKKLLSYTMFSDQYPLPPEQKSAQTLYTHPQSSMPLIGYDLPPDQYVCLGSHTPKSTAIWVQDNPHKSFSWKNTTVKALAPKTLDKGRISFEKSFAFALNDYVIHIEYGLGRFQGIETFQDGKRSIDCLRIRYADNTDIYIPATDAHNIHFFADKDDDISLGALKEKSWLLSKKKNMEEVYQFAQKLLDTAAKRSFFAAPLIAIDHHLLKSFSATFPHPLSTDQEQALNDIITDFNSSIPMNRVLCADVGFGKTEVAMRAAFLAASAGTQVLFIAPTVLLALQHYQRYQERFKKLGIHMAMMSKLTSTTEKANLKKLLKEGEVDILITTHSAFQTSLRLPNLALCIIDEEHLFGVEQKEYIKVSYPHAHILAMSATPIPRTLHMALAGIQTHSTLSTPPPTLKKCPVSVRVCTHKVSFIQNYVRERLPLGKIFFIVPYIKNMVFYESYLRDIAPFVVLTGKTKAEETERNLLAFSEGEIPLMLSTNIIGLGMDIAHANTLIVVDSHMFGLSQLYQMKGRVGRHGDQGEALFSHPPIESLTPNAQKRLKIIQENTSLGSHMAIARADMSMRGTGRMTGKEQTGHLFNLGPSLYQTLLSQAIQKAQNKDDIPSHTAEVTTWEEARFSECFIPTPNDRIDAYRISTRIQNIEELEEFKKECIREYGEIDEISMRWFSLLRLRIICQNNAIQKLFIRKEGLVISWSQEAEFLAKSTEDIIAILHDIRIKPQDSNRLIFYTPLKNIDDVEKALLFFLRDVGNLTVKMPH